MYEPERVSTLTRSPMFTNRGTFTVAPVSSVAGLLPPPLAGSPRTPGSGCVTSSSTDAHFMDSESYDQIAVPEDQVRESLNWVVPNEEVELLYVDEAPQDIQVPSAVELGVRETEPGVRGDTASGGGDKPATLESGVVVRVPLFVNEGDRVRVDTRSGEYVSRA